MNEIVIKTFVVRDGVELSNVPNYDDSIYGSVFSDEEELRINRIRDGYSILYTDSVFREFNVQTFRDALKDIIISNVVTGNSKLIFEFHYFWFEQLDQMCALKIIELTDDFVKDGEELIAYKYGDSDVTFGARMSESGTFLLNRLRKDYFNLDNQQQIQEEPIGEMENNIIDDEVSIDDIDDDEEDDEDYISSLYPTRNKPKNIYKSRLIRLNNARRNINRHGIIITDNKQLVRREAKMLRKLLREIYGTEKWKREFIDEILNLIMFRTVMSKKEAKRRTRIHNHSEKDDVTNKNGIINFTKNVLSQMKYDPFYDANR